MELRNLHLLVIDDDIEDADLTVSALRDAGVRTPVLRAESLEDACRLIAEEPTLDACLLDDHLGPWRAATSLPRLRNAGLTAPVLIVTGQDDEDIADHLLRLGAQDYLPKADLTGRLLARSLRHAIDRAAWSRELLESKASIAAALDALPPMACILDRDGRISATNATWRSAGQRRSLGWDDGGIGKDYIDVVRRAAHNGAPGAAEALEALDVVRDGRAMSAQLEYDYDVETLDGPEVRLFRLIVAPFADDPSPRRLLVMHEDITAARDVEVARRESQKMEALGQLAGGVAHDFNNLLTTIRLSADIIRSGGHDDEDFRDLVTAVDQARDITRQLLTFGRRQVLQLTVIDLKELLRDSERLLQRVLPESIGFSVILPEQKLPVVADPTQLVQALLNLIINARDAVRGTGVITVEVESLTLTHASLQPDGAMLPAGDYAVMAVCDTGTGLSSEIRERIFEPFFTTKASGEGTGLGLAIVHGIVHQLGGRIGVESEIGVGTTFRLYLPLAVGGVALPAKARAPERRTNLRILVVEDEESLRKLVVRILQRSGASVVTTRHGRDALQKLEDLRWEIDLVITDVVMPEMGGGELADAIRQRDANMPLLFVSGYPRDASVIEEISKGHTAFLAKPFSTGELLDAVADAMRGASPLAAGAKP